MLRVAFLNSQYPSISHTFIEREIRELRARGFRIDTFSINPPRPGDQLGAVHAAESKNTTALKLSLLSLFLKQPRAFLRWPRGYLRALAECQRSSQPGLKPRAKSLGYLLEAAALALELEARDLRHVHVHMANNAAAVALLACAIDARLEYSLSIHGSAEFFDVQRLNLKAKCEQAVFVRCISDFCRAQIMTWVDPTAWTRFHVVHCAIDPDAFKPALPNASERGPLRLLSVGRLEPIKGYPLLLEAIARLVSEGVDVRLEMVGGGLLEDALREQVLRTGLEKVVTMRGALSAEDVQLSMERNDVLVVSSFMEGIPVVLMEAMAKGLAVICTSVGGVGELVEHGVNGCLIRPGSVDALVNAIMDLSRGQRQLEAMRHAARATILREFDIRKTGQMLHGLFERYCPGAHR